MSQNNFQSVTCSATPCLANSISFIAKPEDLELNAIITQAYQDSPWVRRSLCEQASYYHQVYQDQTYLLNLNNKLWALQQEDLSALQAKTLARVEKDLYFVTQLNKVLADYSATEQGGVTWALKTNKMQDILTHAHEIIADNHQFSAIVQGELPQPFGELPQVVLLGKSEESYGNSKATYLSAAILEVNLELLNQTHVQAIPAPGEINWVDQSAIVHVTPIPEFIAATDIAPQFSDQFSFYFSDPMTEQGLVFVHTGYAFGGHRYEMRYPEGKQWGPEDCSSWLAKLTQAEIPFSTIDQLFTFRAGLPAAEQGYIEPNWINSETAKVMQALYSPVKVEDPFTDIQAGQIFAFRTFSDAEHLHSPGNSGHTGLVLGVRENGNIVALAYARDMPLTEGFGIQEFPWHSTEKREMMFFNIKTDPLTKADIFTDTPDIFGEAPSLSCPLLPAPQAEPLIAFQQHFTQELAMEQPLIMA